MLAITSVLGLYKRVCVIFLLFSPLVFATTWADTVSVVASPDYGANDCVSFKTSKRDTNPLSYPYGYACVTATSCEVFDHACVGDYCDAVDYSKGTRTSMTAVALPTRVDQILMAATGVHLKDHKSRWCLVEDGLGNFWALDKLRGHEAQFTRENVQQTVKRCRASDFFNSETGCVAR